MLDWDLWDLQPSRVLMHPDDFRDILVWGYLEEGHTERVALSLAAIAMEQLLQESEPSTDSVIVCL